MYPNIAVYRKSKKTTKDNIINILSYEWPLSARKVFYMLKKNYGQSITYQAVYKALSQMLDDKIIKKSKNSYSLSLDWVKDIHDQTEIIRVNYFSENHTSMFSNKEFIRMLVFKTWFDVEKYLYYLQKNYITKSKKKQVICYHHCHEWRPLFYLRAEYNWVKKLRKLGHKTYTLCAGNQFTDKWSKNFYEKAGAKIKLNAKISETSDTLIFGDLVIQIYIPLELKQALKKELKKIKSLEDIKPVKLISNIFEKKSQIKVIINKDEKLAEELKNQTLSKFKS